MDPTTGHLHRWPGGSDPEMSEGEGGVGTAGTVASPVVEGSDAEEVEAELLDSVEEVVRSQVRPSPFISTTFLILFPGIDTQSTPCQRAFSD